MKEQHLLRVEKLVEGMVADFSTAVQDPLADQEPDTSVT